LRCGLEREREREVAERTLTCSTSLLLAQTLERQLAKSQKKNNDYEDAIIAIEREKGSWAAQMSELQRRLEAENKQRLKLEDDQLKRNSELTGLQDRLGRTERELLKVGTDFDAIDAEVRLLRSRENKTIVEHVHVLEAAKRLTDRQLAEAKLELQSLTVYVKSLEKTKARDAEDLSRQGERERAAARNQESVIKAAEERARLKLLKELQSSNENMATGISSQARSLLNHSNISNSNSSHLPFTNGHHSSSNQNQNQSSEKAQVELAEARRQIAEFNFERKKLQTEAAQLKTKLEEQQKSSSSVKGESSGFLLFSLRVSKPFTDWGISSSPKLARQPLSPTLSSSDTVLRSFFSSATRATPDGVAERTPTFFFPPIFFPPSPPELQQSVQTLKSKYSDCFSKFEAAEAARLQAEELVLSREQELRDLRVSRVSSLLFLPSSFLPLHVCCSAQADSESSLARFLGRGQRSTSSIGGGTRGTALQDPLGSRLRFRHEEGTIPRCSRPRYLCAFFLFLFPLRPSGH